MARGSTESRVASDIEAADVSGEILQEQRWEHRRVASRAVSDRWSARDGPSIPQVEWRHHYRQRGGP
eukprot:6653348-Pyramimonas_sp.AAC.1